MKGLFWRQTWPWFVIGILLLGFAGACSNDSGGDDLLPLAALAAEEEIEYTGVTTPAAIDHNNAQLLLEEAFSGGTTGSGVVAPFAMVAGSAPEAEEPSLVFLFKNTIRGIAEKIALVAQRDIPAVTGAVISDSINEEGPCGGTCSGSLSIDDQTGDISGSLRFRNYCDSGLIANGRVRIEGSLHLGWGDMVLYMDFSNFRASYGDISQTMDGVVRAVIDNTLITASNDLTLNIYVRDDASGRVCWMCDYAMEVDGYSSQDLEYLYDQVNISGYFYDPDYGYVVLSTPEPFIIYTDEMYPSSGLLEAVGTEVSSGGNTRARLVVLTTETYRIDVDEDGDGFYEWRSDTQSWED